MALEQASSQCCLELLRESLGDDFDPAKAFATTQASLAAAADAAAGAAAAAAAVSLATNTESIAAIQPGSLGRSAVK